MAKRWVAVEEDDANGCDPCGAVDGKLYRTREDAYRDYPGGVGFKDCIGAQYGNACRGKVVKRRGAEREGNSGMKRHTKRISNLLAANTSLAEQAKQLMHAPEMRDKRPGDWFRIENATAEEATVYIYDEIGFWGTSAQGFVDQLNAITAPKLSIRINSPGGEVFDGVAIHSALMSSKAHVTVFIDGLAASAASFIAMAGDRIVMARHATMMIHDASGLCWGNPADMAAMGGLLDKLSDNIADMYSLQAGGTVEEWRNLMRAETWYTGQEALAAGLVDEITSPDEEEEPAEEPRNRLSLAAFNFAGRAEAPAPEISEREEEKDGEAEGDPAFSEEKAEEEYPLPDGDETLPEDHTSSPEYERELRLALLAASLKS
jgi:ATP-dependent protease ClpP protease subunit